MIQTREDAHLARQRFIKFVEGSGKELFQDCISSMRAYYQSKDELDEAKFNQDYDLLLAQAAYSQCLNVVFWTLHNMETRFLLEEFVI
jgi:hypothetical protein